MSQPLLRTVRGLGATLALAVLPVTGVAVALDHGADSPTTVVQATGGAPTDGTTSGKDTTGWD
ncbi:hypothetical protein B9W68_02015 [Streptomyces sp. CS227]|uniref:hypothetical protein n=1 Tax=Streptomyces sp. CS227 TaxID=1982763 RepID=UPI000B422B8C|nr:hypothetical protein [Streptomyces sp. CS227]OWA19287.1 hypothetical protein B9W68_02015 [Streptomyces sp. CS227]